MCRSRVTYALGSWRWIEARARAGSAQPVPRRALASASCAGHARRRRAADDVGRGERALDRRGARSAAAIPRLPASPRAVSSSDAVERGPERLVGQRRRASRSPRPRRRRPAPPTTWWAARNGTPRRTSASATRRRGRVALLGGVAHPVAVDGERLDDPGHDRERGVERGDRGEQRRLVLLEVALVRERQPLEQREHRGERADHAAPSGRGRARPGRGSSCWASSRSPVENASATRTNPNRGFDHQVISSASRERWTIASAAAASDLDDEVAVAHGVERVARDALEPELGGGRLAVERVAGARERARPERRDVRRGGARRRAGRGRAPASRRRRAGGGRAAPAGRAGCASCPGRTASPSRSARPTSARSRPTSAGVQPVDRPAQSTAARSVATWSLRERPVWSFPPTGPDRARSSSVSRFMWTSSRAGSHSTAPASTSARSETSPRSSVATSSSVSSPARPSPRTCAIEPAMSSSASAASTSIERVKSAIRASGPPSNRPPHIRIATPPARRRAAARPRPRA